MTNGPASRNGEASGPEDEAERVDSIAVTTAGSETRPPQLAV